MTKAIRSTLKTGTGACEASTILTKFPSAQRREVTTISDDLWLFPRLIVKHKYNSTVGKGVIVNLQQHGNCNTATIDFSGSLMELEQKELERVIPVSCHFI